MCNHIKTIKLFECTRVRSACADGARRRTFYKKQFFIAHYWYRGKQSTRVEFQTELTRKKSSSKPFRKKFRSKTHPFTLRSSGHVSARFLFKKFVWTVRNSFAEQIFIFFAVLCIQHFALFFKRMSCLLLSGPRSRFYSRVYYVSCMGRFISTLGRSSLLQFERFITFLIVAEACAVNSFV